MPKRTTKTNWTAVQQIKHQFQENDVNCSDHFRINKLQCYEIARVRETRRTKYNINYHFVWIPKTRSKILYGQIAQSIKSIIIEICKDKGWFPLAMEVMPNHIHFFMSAPPKWAPAIIMKNLKGIISRRIREKYPILTKYRKNGIWADSYYVGTAGHVSQEQVVKYIAEQTKDQELEEYGIKPFSYSVFQKEQKTLQGFFGD